MSAPFNPSDQTVLVPGEQVRLSETFSPNVILKHLTVTLTVTDRRVIVRQPNTIFGLIPLGYLESTSGLHHIAGVTAGESFSTRRVLYGAAAIIFGLFALLGGSFLAGSVISALLGVVLIVFGVYLLAKVHEIGISFRNAGGGALFAPAGRSERARVDQARNHINYLLFGPGAAGSGRS